MVTADAGRIWKAAPTKPPMPRTVLDESRLHPDIRERVADHHADVVHNVQAAASSHPVLVVGMAQNPLCRKARQLLDAAGVSYQYLEFGSYFSEWRRRNALKMWSGWPTFPMVFLKGVLIGGASDLEGQLKSGELKRVLGQ